VEVGANLRMVDLPLEVLGFGVPTVERGIAAVPRPAATHAGER
jgi:hypothetical protein